MKNLNIVLIEPQIPQNTGNISRTCAVTGAKLHLVRPFGFEITDKHLKRAGLDYWDKLDIFYYDNVDEFFEKNQGNYFFFTTKGKNVYSNVEYPDDAYLIFPTFQERVSLRNIHGRKKGMLNAENKICNRFNKRYYESR